MTHSGCERRNLKGERIAYIGMIDNIVIVGNTIYILDYKPNLHFATIEQMTAEGSGNPLPRKHFITSIPQVGGYGIIIDALFKLKAAGFNIQCITYNSEAYCAYDPFSALEQSVDFYYEHAKKFPDWAWLLDEGLLRKMADKHKIDF